MRGEGASPTKRDGGAKEGGCAARLPVHADQPVFSARESRDIHFRLRCGQPGSLKTHQLSRALSD